LRSPVTAFSAAASATHNHGRTDLAEADCRLGLHLTVSAPLGVAATQRLHQALGGSLDVMLQVGLGPQRHLVDGEFAGIGAAHRHEVDQGGDLFDLRGVDLGRGSDILVGALTGCGGPGPARSIPTATSWKYRRDRRVAGPTRSRWQIEFGTAADAVMKGSAVAKYVGDCA
jgi:hypothetical protein